MVDCTYVVVWTFEFPDIWKNQNDITGALLVLLIFLPEETDGDLFSNGVDSLGCSGIVALVLLVLVLFLRAGGGGRKGGFFPLSESVFDFDLSLVVSESLSVASTPQQPPLLKYAYMITAGIITTNPMSTNRVDRSNLGAKCKVGSDSKNIQKRVTIGVTNARMITVKTAPSAYLMSKILKTVVPV